MLVLHNPREKPNKMLKYLFSPTNAIPTYLLKESKLIKWGQQENKPIKSSHVEKKITSKSLKKNKTLLYSTLIELAFQMAFFHWNMHGKKSYIYTIQNVILSICLFKIASPIRDALTLLNFLSNFDYDWLASL